LLTIAAVFTTQIIFRNNLNSRQSLISQSFGVFPKNCAQPPKDVVETTVEANADYKLLRVTISGCAGPVSSLIGIPNTPSKVAVIALPQTSVEGADEVMGLRGDPKLSFGLKFLKSGYTVISPDVFLAGQNYDPKRDWDTAALYKSYPNWSAAGRMVADNEMAAELAKTYAPGATCTMAVGHSLGGHNALFLAYFDPTIDVVISNAGFEMMDSDENPQRWSRKSWFIYFKNQPKWDFSDILRTLKEKKVFIFQGDKDPIWKNSNRLPADIEKLHLNNINLIMFNGAHEFPEQMQQRAIEAANDCASK
jgi:dienelactone hydrolase